MATIKAIEARSVHQIQSGQVIVDLCSVVKELVENSLDAGASSVEIRFKNNGLDSIEVQDNGSGISPANYENVALKHYTSKLSGYEDLNRLQTFGFRGEALSSLCALSKFSIITAQAHEAPKGKRLDFEVSGKLRSTSVVASQKGTTATVEDLFEQLPVRRKELTKNIKREYAKVLGLLHAYACICTTTKFNVKNTMPKGKTVTVFATQSNATTRDNIANVYGAKTLSALITLDLDLSFQPTLTQMSRGDAHDTQVKLCGHISRPVFGEGRQTPDRQMFFVNGRPCGLPQIAKAINEVYKSYNVSQSPFIFADFRMDTNAYDVNVSPDKRTILLHNATALIDKLKDSLTSLFDAQDYTVPQSRLSAPTVPAYKQLSISNHSETTPIKGHPGSGDDDINPRNELPSLQRSSLLQDHFRDQASTREEHSDEDVTSRAKLENDRERRMAKLAKAVAVENKDQNGTDEYDDVREIDGITRRQSEEELSPQPICVRDFNERMAAEQKLHEHHHDKSHPDTEKNLQTHRDKPPNDQEETGIVRSAFERIRPRKQDTQIATITIGEKTITTLVGSQISRPLQEVSQKKSTQIQYGIAKDSAMQQFSQNMRRFTAVASNTEDTSAIQSGPEESNVLARASSEMNPISDEEEDTMVVDNHADESERQSSASDEPQGSSDDEYVDEDEKTKLEEELRVAKLIQAAEENASVRSKESSKRANKALQSSKTKDYTMDLISRIDIPLESLKKSMESWYSIHNSFKNQDETENDEPVANSEEERLSLTVSKDDFAKMEVVGQFNLGFILAVRKTSPTNKNATKDMLRKTVDELFIIDQHASDEKFNFERLQLETVVNNQRLVRPGILDLTAVEEEVVMENVSALEKNGFLVEVDESGARPVGQRCKLVSLPLSKEVVFDHRDLDELIHLLAEMPPLNEDSVVPRPGKVRKMFAMRACRSSIMIGKTLSKKQMSTVVRNMGTIDKPWNCPHGRPTMRHLTSLNAFSLWREGNGRVDDAGMHDNGDVWRTY